MKILRLVLVCLVVVPLVAIVATNPVFVPSGPAYSSNQTVSESIPGRTAMTGTAFVVLGGDGTVEYHETRRDEYWDVDPIQNTSSSVIVSTVTHDSEQVDCANCVVQRIERINVSTGARSVLYKAVTPGKRNVEWHDVDRINETHYLIADISQHEIETVDITTDTTVWEWSAYTSLPPSSGGPFDGDWTHLNDVELVRNGQYVTVSLRNHDTVIFVNRTTGQTNETLALGEDDNHSILDEQHNPDYIPEERGGPAMIVADSNNDRIVEYQLEDGQWVQSWVWQDERLKWPRDADRLPNGHTLVTDTNGNRVLEVDKQGRVLWSFSPSIAVYEAERLSTPDESGGGTAASAAGLRSRTVQPDSPSEQAIAAIEGVLGPRLVNGIFSVTPEWMRLSEFLIGLVSPLSFVTLLWYELAARNRLPGR